MKLSYCCVVALAGAVLTPLAFGATVGQIDTFQSGINGWFAGGLGLGMVPPVPPQVIATGGPRGAGDAFLQITGLGGTGAGSRIVAMNNTQWAGNYLSPGISGIAMDLKNFGSTTLTIRLLFEDPLFGPPADEAVTTFGQVLPVGGPWVHAFFAISPSSLTVLSGNVNTLLSNTTLLRIIDSPTPDDAVSIVGVLGVDNINAVPEPGTWLSALGALGCAVASCARKRR
jgi:hypothetical protein